MNKFLYMLLLTYKLDFYYNIVSRISIYFILQLLIVEASNIIIDIKWWSDLRINKDHYNITVEYDENFETTRAELSLINVF